MAWTEPKTWEILEQLTAAKMNEQLRDNTAYLKDTLDDFLEGTFTEFKRAWMWHRAAIVTAGNGHHHYVNSSHYFGCYSGFHHSQIAKAANGDTWTNGCWLSAGTYIFNVLGVKRPESGKIDWKLDDNQFVTGQDWYNPSESLFNVVFTTTSIAVEATGWHTLRGKINGKNGSSGGYLHMLTAYWFTPSSD